MRRGRSPWDIARLLFKPGVPLTIEDCQILARRARLYYLKIRSHYYPPFEPELFDEIPRSERILLEHLCNNRFYEDMRS